MESAGGLSPMLRFQAAIGFRLARLGLLCFALVVGALAIADAGTEDEPALRLTLMAAVGVFVTLGAVVAIAAWRLSVTLEGPILSVRSLRTRTIDLSKVDRVGSRGIWLDGPAIVFAETTSVPARRRLATLPIGTLVARTFMVSAWRVNDARELFPAVFAALPAEVSFAEGATAPFADAGCAFDEAT